MNWIETMEEQIRAEAEARDLIREQAPGLFDELWRALREQVKEATKVPRFASLKHRREDGLITYQVPGPVALDVERRLLVRLEPNNPRVVAWGTDMESVTIDFQVGADNRVDFVVDGKRCDCANAAERILRAFLYPESPLTK
ncbi:MAG TPA: hypothetical protein VFO89_14740 [Thermoanaerobaculia bacterium]|nr:hypothetical protein [Thermoanaerobaculia bacterium]